MSWSSAAYSSSSRSSGPSRCSPVGARGVEELEREPRRPGGRAARRTRSSARAAARSARARRRRAAARAGRRARGRRAAGPRAGRSRPARRWSRCRGPPGASSRIAAPATMMSARAGVRPGTARRSSARHRAQALGHRAQVLAREGLVAARRAPVQRARRDRGEVHDGARRAVGGGVRPADVAQRVLRREAHAVLERLVVLGVVAAVVVRPRALRGQPDGAERDGLHEVGAGGVADGDLRAPAADVDHQRAPVDVHAAEQAEVDEPGLLAARRPRARRARPSRA